MRTRSQRDIEGKARLGLTVSRRVGNSVIRNRVKRQVREWFRRDGESLARGRDFVAIARPGAAGMGTSEVAAELNRLAAIAENHVGSPAN